MNYFNFVYAGVPELAKGGGLKILWRRPTWVRIPSPALYQLARRLLFFQHFIILIIIYNFFKSFMQYFLIKLI